MIGKAGIFISAKGRSEKSRTMLMLISETADTTGVNT